MNQFSNLASLVALAVSALSFVLLLYTARKSSLLRFTQKQLELLQLKVDELGIRIDDMYSRLNNTVTAVTKQTSLVDKRLAKLEDKLASGALGGFKLEIESSRELEARLKEENGGQLKTADSVPVSEKPKDSVQPPTAPSPKKAQTLVIPRRTLPELLKGTRERVLADFNSILQGESVSEKELQRQAEKTLEAETLHLILGKGYEDALKSELEKQLSDTSLTVSAKSISARIGELVASAATDLACPLPLRRGDGEGVRTMMLVGAEGVGKSTAALALGQYFLSRGWKGLVCDCDTNPHDPARSLAQLARKPRVPLVSSPRGSKSASVAYRAVHQAQDEGFEYLVIDTAPGLDKKGRISADVLQVANMVTREMPLPPHETLLVLNASDLKTARSHVEKFTAAGEFSGILFTNVDKAKVPGSLVSFAHEVKMPIWFVVAAADGTDIYRFVPRRYTEALFGQDERRATAAPPESPVTTTLN